MKLDHACSELRKPASGRAIPFAELPEVGTREGTPLFSYFFLQIDNKVDIRVLWIFIRKIDKRFPCFRVDKFHGIIKIQKI